MVVLEGECMAVHPLAVVDPKATLADDAVVGPFCVVGPEVTLAAGVELTNHVTVTGKTTIGEQTRVFPGAVVGGDPQDLKFHGENSEVRIGARCRIHECATINKGTAGGGMITEIGDDVLIMAYAHVAHDCRLGDQVVLGNQSQLAGHVVIERRAVVSGMVGVHHFVTVARLPLLQPPQVSATYHRTLPLRATLLNRVASIWLVLSAMAGTRTTSMLPNRATVACGATVTVTR